MFKLLAVKIKRQILIVFGRLLTRVISPTKQNTGVWVFMIGTCGTWMTPLARAGSHQDSWMLVSVTERILVFRGGEGAGEDIDY